MFVLFRPETAEFYVVDVRRISSLEHKYELVP